MKILLYSGCINIVKRSGVGRAFEHQKKAMTANKIAFTSDPRNKYDIIQLNTIFPDSVIAAYIAKLKGKKVVYYGHSTMEDFCKSFRGSDLLAPIFKRWITFCYNRGDVIITPTKYSKNVIQSYGINKPIIQLSNGIDMKFYNRREGDGNRFKKRYHIKSTEKVIISIGHYMERKGILEFVELAKQMPEYKFIWFGFTNLTIIPGKVKDAVSTKLPNLIFPGYVTREEIRDAYAGSDLFLFLTYEETEGIVLLEALAMETPIIVRDIPIYKDCMKENEVVYKSNTMSEFKAMIQKVLNKELPDITRQGYLTVKEKEIGCIGKELKQIYGRIAGGE